MEEEFSRPFYKQKWMDHRNETRIHNANALSVIKLMAEARTHWSFITAAVILKS